jgi:hypothetical protein
LVFTKCMNQEPDTRTQGLKNNTVYTALRPPKVVVFLDSNEDHWHELYTHLIEVLCTFWGGDGYIVIPTNGTDIPQIFQDLIKEYDPDYLAIYQKTGRDLAAIDPAAFEVSLNEQLERNLRGASGLDPDATRGILREQLLGHPWGSNFEISGRALEFLNNQTSSFRWEHNPIEIELDYSGKHPYQLPAICEVLTSGEVKADRQIHELDIPRYGKDMQLMAAATAGRSSLQVGQIRSKIAELEGEYQHALNHRLATIPVLRERLRFLNEIASVRYQTFGIGEMSAVTDTIWKRRVDITQAGFLRSLARTIAGGGAPPQPSDDGPSPYDYFGELPFFIANTGLSYFSRSSDSAKKELGSPLVVIGDSLEDFALYHSLSRLRDKVYWLPYRVLSMDRRNTAQYSYTAALISHLNSDFHRSERTEVLWITHSLSQTIKNRIPSKIADCSISIPRAEVEGWFKEVASIKDALPYLLRMYEVGSANNYLAYQFLDGKGVNYISTPLPKTFMAESPSAHKWVVELNIKNYIYPQAPALSKLAFDGENLSHFHTTNVGTRVSRSGICYLAISTGFIRAGARIEDNLVLPRLNFIEPLSIFNAVFSRLPYSLRISDKGNYLQGSIELAGGLAPLAALIRTPALKDLFNLFLKGKEIILPGHSGGVFTDSRRYLDIYSIASLIAGNMQTRSTPRQVHDARNTAGQLAESLLKNKIIERGYVLKCTHCANTSWYSLADITEAFICIRCRRSGEISGETLGHQPPNSRYEPILYYRLNELFYQFWKNNGFVTILTLAKLNDGSESSFIFLPEVEFWKEGKTDKPDFELDILAIRDGHLYMGEAKLDGNGGRGNRLEPKLIKQLIYFGKKVPLRGMVFASLSDRWPQEFMDLLASSGARQTYEVLNFGSEELLAR